MEFIQNTKLMMMTMTLWVLALSLTSQRGAEIRKNTIIVIVSVVKTTDLTRCTFPDG
jgi:hypothetical protein